MSHGPATRNGWRATSKILSSSLRRPRSRSHSILAGAISLLRRGWASATFVFVMAVCPPITFAVAYFRKFLLYENYVIYSLPGVVVCAAAGILVVASCV